MGSERRWLVLTELFLPTKGGTAVWFDEVYRRLGGRGIHILTADVPGAAEHDRTQPNTVHRLGLRHNNWLRPASLPVYLKFFSVGLGIALRHGCNEVHAGRVLPEGLAAWAVSRLIRRPVIIYAHGEELTTWRRSWKRLRAMSFAFRHADKVIANSEYTRGELLKLGVGEGNIVIVYPGVDIERFHPHQETAELRHGLGLDGSQKLILSVGRLSRRKGFDQVIRALPALLERGLDAYYAVVGIGEDREYLQSLALAEGVSDRVHLLGHVSPDDLPRWYRAADVFTMPNREIDGDTEGFGMVFLEASACATPVVAGLAGGTGAAVVDGVTGLRVDGAALQQVTEALARVLGDPVLARKLGKNGHRRAVQDFAWPRVAQHLDDLSSSLRRKTNVFKRSQA